MFTLAFDESQGAHIMCVWTKYDRGNQNSMNGYVVPVCDGHRNEALAVIYILVEKRVKQ